MSFTLATVLLNLAYLVYAVSGLFKDMLTLRLVLMCATVFFLAHGVVDQLWPAVYWNIPVLCVHLWMVTSLLMARRGINLDDEAEAIHTLLFTDLDRVSFSTMWNLGEERHFDNDVLLVKNEAVTDLILLLDGEVTVIVNSNQIVRLGHYRLIGEMSSLSGSGAGASATVTCDGPVRARTWNKEALDKWGAEDPAGRIALLHAMGRELSQKLNRQQNAES